MTRTKQTEAELRVAWEFLGERGYTVVDIRKGAQGAEPDAIATTSDGLTRRIEVARVVDEEDAARVRGGIALEIELTNYLRPKALTRGGLLRGAWVCIQFPERPSRRSGRQAIDAALDVAAASTRPMPPGFHVVRPTPAGVAHVEIHQIAGDFEPIASVSKAGAFFPELDKVYDKHAVAKYAGPDVTFLAVIPNDETGLGVGPWMTSAVEHLRERLGDRPAPFAEIVLFDERSRTVVATIPGDARRA